MQDAWGGDLPDVHVREIATRPAVDPQEGAVAWTESVIALGDLLEASRSLAKGAVIGAITRIEALDGGSVLTMVAAIQDLRRELGEIESLLAREAGRDEATPREGRLPDGRRYVVRRGANRKSWDHNLWRRDVRAQVLSGVSESLHDPETGEVVDVPALLAAVQEVHGSAAPKVTSLRRLGLDVEDYCETFPGPWAVQVIGETGEEGD